MFGGFREKTVRVRYGACRCLEPAEMAMTGIPRGVILAQRAADREPGQVAPMPPSGDVIGEAASRVAPLVAR